MVPRVVPLLTGRPGPWPHAGSFYGFLDDGDPEGPWVAWAGRVGPAACDAVSLETSWRASRTIHRSMLRGGLPERERRGAVLGAWRRLDPGLVLPGIGPLHRLEPHELHLLVVAGDRAGLALCATGLAGVAALGAGERWAEGAHPLAAGTGLPRRPGVLTVDWADLRPLPPAWLVGMCPGDVAQQDPRALAAGAGATR